MLRKIFFFTALAMYMNPLLVLADSLSVRMEPPNIYKIASRDSRWTVFLEGEIDSEAPARLKQSLEKIGDAGAEIYLDSPGGSLLAGLELGRVIRKNALSTNIGKKLREDTKIQPGNCLSACSLAFLGGISRYMLPGSNYGVHRFSSTATPSSNDLDTGQILSAAISNYILEMGVSPALFDRMVRAGKDEIYLLTPDEAKSMQVINNGRQRVEWSIEMREGLPYLRGAQLTEFGMGKTLFICEKRNLFLHSIYEAGEAANSIAKGGWSHSLMIDSNVLPLSNPIRIENDNGYINAFFALTQNQVQLLYKATTVGHAMQVTKGAPTFVGFKVDIDAVGSNYVRGYIDNCINPR